MPGNRMQRFEFEKWEPMDRVTAPGINEKVPRRYLNAAMDARGALSLLGESSDSPVVVDASGGGTAGSVIKDVDETGILITEDGGGYSRAHRLISSTAASTSDDVFTSYEPLRLYEGVGAITRDSGLDMYMNVLLRDGSWYSRDTYTAQMATISASANAAAGNHAAGDYAVMAVTFLITAQGLVWVGRDTDIVTVADGDAITCSLGFSASSIVENLPHVVHVYVGAYTSSGFEEMYLAGASTAAYSTPKTISIDSIPSSAVTDQMPDANDCVVTQPGPWSRANGAVYSVPAIQHQRRFYMIGGRSFRGGAATYVQNPTKTTNRSPWFGYNGSYETGRVILYTERGYVNFASGKNWFEVPFTGHNERITGLLSTPAGLLIFGRREMLLARGDPDDANFSVQLVSTSRGSDSQALSLRPKRLGGKAFYVSQGRLFVQQFGMGDVDFGGEVEELSLPLTDPQFRNDPYAIDSFWMVPRRNEVVVITRTVSNAKKVLVYSPDTKNWSEWPSFPGQSGAPTAIVPYLGGVEYAAFGAFPDATAETVELAAMIRPPKVSTYGELEVEYADVSGGDREGWMLFVGAEVFTTEGVPWVRLDYTTTEGATGTLSLTDRGDGVWRGYFPKGLVARALTSLKFRSSLLGSQRVFPKAALFVVPRRRAV